MAPRILQLAGSCNHYPWGKKGTDSLAARLCANTPDSGCEIDDNEVYSEMWFGDYPDFPAKWVETGELLADILKKDPEGLLGKNAAQEFGGQLPFLPKILSIAQALPLQIHPPKALAEKLHEKDPKRFTDSNHKPEIAIALSKFEVFAGWKPLSVVSVLLNIPALRQFIPEGTTSWTNSTLKEVVRGLLKADEKLVREIEENLKQHPRSELDHVHQQGYILDLLPRLQEQYGSEDPGSLVALLCMNYMVLEPGEALFIPVDGIHAYLSGDIVECMARSNNVLNSGFYPRADRDNIDLFVETLAFSSLSEKDIILHPKRCEEGVKGQTVVFDPPIREFSMLKTDLAENSEECIREQEGPSIAIGRLYPIQILNHIPSLGRELEERRVPDTKPSFPLEAYAALFVHNKTPFKIDIQLDKEKNGLTITLMGHEIGTYELRHYHYDTFTWWISLNESASRGRFLCFYQADTFLFNFEGTDRFTWLSGDIGAEAYVFLRG